MTRQEFYLGLDTNNIKKVPLYFGYSLALNRKFWLPLYSFRCKDVAAVDINMGCPKSFSISGGMGAALLTKPELIHDVCIPCSIWISFLFPPTLFLNIAIDPQTFLFSTQILTTLKRNLDIPITCKIRLLKSSQDTVDLARRIEKTGVSALAVHGR